MEREPDGPAGLLGHCESSPSLAYILAAEGTKQTIKADAKDD